MDLGVNVDCKPEYLYQFALMSNAAKRAAELAEKKLAPSIELADASPPAFSDDALAQKFAERHGDNLRYIADWAHWYEWDGARWAREPTHHAFDHARAICRVAALEAKAGSKTSTAVKLASAKTVAAVERLAKVDRRIAATVDQWDLDPDIFGDTLTRSK